MLPYFVAALATLALLASLHKDRAVERTDRRVVRALRIHHGMQVVLVAVALWSAVDSDRSARALRQSQILSSCRDSAIGLRAELERRTTLRYLLSRNPNFKNAPLNASPAGIEIAESEFVGVVSKLKLLLADLTRALGPEADEARRIAHVLSLVRDRSMRYTMYGNQQFVQEMNSATTEAERAAVFARHPESSPASAATRTPVVVAPGGRWYFMEQTEQILDGLTHVSTTLGQRLPVER